MLKAIAIFITAALLPSDSPAAPRSEIAVTFDDLPVVTAARLPLAQQQTITSGLLRQITSRKVPAAGFVNGDKLLADGSLQPERVKLLEQWLDAGLELGSHTYSHIDLHRVSAERYEEDIIRGETPLRALIEKRGGQLRYFRHPFLHTGTSDATRTRIDAFLAGRGYKIAPVTIDNSEWIYARAYDVAVQQEDAALRRKVVDDYVEYMLTKIAYYDKQAQTLFERDIRHVLLVHANALNAEAFGTLADRLAARGHQFIPLQRALDDPAYKSPDAYRGAGGISWLDRWALTRGVPKGFFAGEPRTPKWVQELAGIEE